MAKTSDSSDGGEVDAIETTNISPSVENYCKRTIRWVSLLYAKINAINVVPSKHAALLKDLEDLLAKLDDKGDLMKRLDTIEIMLRKADVESKLKKRKLTTPTNPAKKRKTTSFELPASKSMGVLDILGNIVEFATLFEVEAIRLNRKIDYGSADAARIDPLEKDASLSKELMLRIRETLRVIINTMKAKENFICR